MTNNVNMSDYQKLIFVNNINENDFKNDELNNIKQLSKDYPFAVFFTILNSNVHNIWHNGTRLTRFIGVDPERCNIKVGSHTLKLNFDYDSGLLGIVDSNQLKSISVTSIKFTTLNNTIDTSNLINAKDNKFTLTIRFEFDHLKSEVNNDSNALKISPDIKIESYDGKENYYFSPLSSPIRSNYGSIYDSGIPTWVEYDYKYEINCDTLINSWSNSPEQRQKYRITSLYDESQYIDLNLQLCLNPISYTIYYGNTAIADNDIIQLQNNSQYTFYINIKPNNTSTYLHSYPENYDARKLWLTVFSENTNVANINGNSQSLKKTINSSTIEFNINTGTPASNSNASSKITLSLSYKLQGSGESLYNGLTKNFTIKLIGESNNCYYYAGFVDPTETNFNGLINFDNKNYTGNLLWNWEEHLSESEGNNDKYFYIAIPYDYKDKIIPCWDGYIMVGNTKLYINATNRFQKLICNDTQNEKWPSNYNGTGIGGKNLDMIVYKSLPVFKGLFYGKIQIQ